MPERLSTPDRMNTVTTRLLRHLARVAVVAVSLAVASPIAAQATQRAPEQPRAQARAQVRRPEHPRAMRRLHPRIKAQLQRRNRVQAGSRSGPNAAPRTRVPSLQQSTAGTASVAGVAKHGDVSGDGNVSALDAQAILTAVVGLPLPDGFIAVNGIADCAHTAVAASDALLVLRYTIGLNVAGFCVGQPFGAAATTIAVTPRDSSVMVGGSLQFGAVLKQQDGTVISRPVAWSSSSPSVASIDTLGFAHGVAEGTTSITASADGATFTTLLRVVLSYLGVVIQPQRVDTLTQIGAKITLTAR